MRAVRQAVTRARRAGLTVRMRRHRELSAEQMAEVIAGGVAIVAVFTWIIRRPVKESIADFDEPQIALEADDSSSSSTSGAEPSRD